MMQYFFTNHRNLLQAATKGFLSPLGGWVRYKADFDETVAKFHSQFLIFSKQLLPYNYGFNSDKTLHGVAIGINEKILQQLGYQETEYGFIGKNPILLDLVDKIVFKSSESRHFLQIHSPEYLHFLDATKISFSKPLFIHGDIRTEPIDLKSDEIPEPIVDEKSLSRAIGSIGHMLIGIQAQNKIEQLLLVDLLSSHLKTEHLDVAWSDLVELVKTLIPMAQFETASAFLTYLLLFYTRSRIGAGDHVNRVLKQNNAKLGDFEFGSYEGLVSFLLALDQAIDHHSKELSEIDRKTLIQTQFDYYANCPKPHKDLQSVLEKVLQSYDYIYTGDQLLEDIQSITDPVIRTFALGFEYFSRDPIDFKNIYRLIDAHDKSLHGSDLSVAMYLWGRTHGSFSFDPSSKLKMLKSFGDRNFYNIVLTNEESRFLTTQELKTNTPKKESVKKVQYLESEYYSVTGLPNERGHYEEVPYRLTSSSGLEIEYKIDDYYNDVDDFLKRAMSNPEEVHRATLKFILEKVIKIQSVLKIAGAQFQSQSLSIEISEDGLSIQHEYNLQDRKVSGIFSMTNYGEWVGLLLDFLNGMSLTIKDKRLIREHLRMLPGKETDKPQASTKKKVATRQPTKKKTGESKQSVLIKATRASKKGRKKKTVDNNNDELTLFS